MCAGKRVCLIVSAVGLLLGMGAGAASALEYGGFDIHGYVSGGFLYSDHNNYLTADTEDGSFRAYDAGLNIGRDITPTLRIGAQGVIRRLGSMGADKPRVDWAHVDYRPLDEVGLRLGILKLPVGLYNEERDLDMLRTAAFLPQGVYNEQLRDFFAGQPGGQVYGHIRMGQAGALGYNVSLVNLRVDEKKSAWGNYFVDSLLLNMGLMQGHPAAFPKMGYDFDNKYTVAGAMIWQTPLEGLRLGASYMHFDTEVSIRTRNPALQEFDMDLTLERYAILSAEYVWNRWRFAAEYMTAKFDMDFDHPGMPDQQRDSSGYYAQLAYRFNEWLELSSYYSIYYPNNKDRRGSTFRQIGQATGRPDLYPDYLGWQKDACVAARFDVNMNWQIKLEWHLIDGVGQLYPSDNPDGFKRNWNFFAAKTTYTF